MAQDYPELYDGPLIAAPAISNTQFGLNAFYAQVVRKADLGFTSADPGFAAAHFRNKVNAVNRRAVQACDREGLGFLLDPFACGYDPTRDAAALCAGVAGLGVLGSNAEAANCVNLKEAQVINKLWYGITRDGRYEPNETPRARSGVALGPQQLWWSLPRGANWGAVLSQVSNAERVVQFMQDVRYAPSLQVSPAVDFVNSHSAGRDKWRDIDHAGLVDVMQRGQALQARIGQMNSDSADLARLRQLGRKVITYTGLAEDCIPPATSVHHYERVVQAQGGLAATQQFVRLYLVPGKAHSSQGRGYVVASASDPGKNNSVPLPALPGAGNQTPTRERDQMFSALVDWVEQGSAPGAITLRSRDGSLSYPICVYPQKARWDGVVSSKVASSYRCG